MFQSLFGVPVSVVATSSKSGKYAEAARKSASRGSKRFIFTTYGDDLQPCPSHASRRAYKDNPFKETFGWIRWRWCWHDFRMFGIKETLKKQWYIGESWRRRDERILAGIDENGGKYWVSRKNSSKQNGRLYEPKDQHWFRGHDNFHMPANYAYWLQGQMAWTPNQQKARGEAHFNGQYVHRVKQNHHMPNHGGYNAIFDPWLSVQPGCLWDPDYNIMKETGYSGWTTQIALPTHLPFFGEHDVDDETIMQYYRRQPWHLGGSHSIDGDEWRVA